MYEHKYAIRYNSYINNKYWHGWTLYPSLVRKGLNDTRKLIYIAMPE